MKTRNSEKRDAILSILKHTTSHPTAEWVYEKLSAQYPDAGIATVYRNLKILLEHGDIIKIDVGDGIDHYDADISEHYHFLCRCCRRIYDIRTHELNFGTIPKKVNDLTIEDMSVVFTGICGECSEKNNIVL